MTPFTPITLFSHWARIRNRTQAIHVPKIVTIFSWIKANAQSIKWQTETKPRLLGNPMNSFNNKYIFNLLLFYLFLSLSVFLFVLFFVHRFALIFVWVCTLSFFHFDLYFFLVPVFCDFCHNRLCSHISEKCLYAHDMRLCSLFFIVSLPFPLLERNGFCSFCSFFLEWLFHWYRSISYFSYTFD